MPDKIKLLVVGVVAVIVLLIVFGVPFQGEQPNVAQEPTKAEVDIRGLQELERAILALKSTIFALELPNKSLGGTIADSVTSRYTNGSALVGTSSAEVLAANSARSWVHLSNCDGHVNFYSFEDTAVIDKGIVIGSTTGTDVDIFGDDAKAKINGISNTTGGIVCYTTNP